MNARSKATDITPRVRATVLRRDDRRCINCHTPYALQLAHVFYNRSHGGLGVERNLVTLCIECHMTMDHSKPEKAQPIRAVAESYLKYHYNDLDIASLKYCKFDGFEKEN